MKWIGQHIWDYISRFRNDIYLESISSGTIASGGHLGLDSDNKIVKASVSSGGISHDGSTADGVLTYKDADEATVEQYLTFANGSNISTLSLLSNQDTGDKFTITTTTHGATTLTTTDDDATAAHFEIAADGNITLDAAGDIAFETAGGTLSCDAAAVNFTGASASRPSFNLINNANDATGPILALKNFRDGNGLEDADVIGNIEFSGADEVGNTQTYATIVASVSEADNADEAGQIAISVANDGTLRNGITMTGDKTVAEEVDVTIANGAASTTTIAGDLSVTTGLILDSVDITAIQTAAELSSPGFQDNDTSLLTAAAIDDRINAASGGSVSVSDSTANTNFPVVFHDESNNLHDDTGAFTYNPSNKPVITLVNGNADATPPVLAFQKTDTGADGDDLGSIKFIGDDDGGANTDYCKVLCEIKESANGSEEGRLSIQVADSTGLQDVIVATGLSGASIPKRHFAIPSDGAGNADGDVVYIGTGSTVIGKIYYYAANGTWQLTNSDDPSTATGWLAVALGNDPDVDGMLVRGTVDLAEDIVGTEALGSIIYLDKATTGAATTAAPTATGDIVRVIGYALTTGNENKIWFSPDNTWVEHV
jgi:hypothetical protein